MRLFPGLWTSRAKPPKTKHKDKSRPILADERDPRPPLHFLHIGKTGGTALRLVFEELNADPAFPFQVIQQSHRVFQNALPPDEAYFFAIREPVSRFVSGFYSRKRKGRPRRDTTWNPVEDWAFPMFPHANDLAEALFEPGERGLRALCAARGIGHVRQKHLDWFRDPSQVLLPGDQRPLFLLRQPHLEADVNAFARAIGYDAPIRMTSDPTAKHANPYDGVPDLSPKARENLQRWLADDIAFYHHCLEVAEEIRGHADRYGIPVVR